MAKRNTYGIGDTVVTVEDFSQEYLIRFQSDLERVMQAVTIDATNEMLDLVTKYQTREDGPSEAGQPPHQFTSRLADSLPEARDVKTEPNRIVGIIGSTVSYARFLEFGTRYMAARPFIRPAVAQTEKKISRIIRNILRSPKR
jgi:HK97 gp10 family phage protein